jgi:hypothetical protein
MGLHCRCCSSCISGHRVHAGLLGCTLNTETVKPLFCCLLLLLLLQVPGMRVVTDHEELELIGEGLPIFHGVSM